MDGLKPWQICLVRAGEWRARYEAEHFEPHAIRAGVLWNLAFEIVPDCDRAEFMRVIEGPEYADR